MTWCRKVKNWLYKFEKKEEGGRKQSTQKKNKEMVKKNRQCDLREWDGRHEYEKAQITEGTERKLEE